MSFANRNLAYGEEVTGNELLTAGVFSVTLESVGNPDRGQSPDHPLWGVSPGKAFVTTLKEASDACRKYIADNELGGGNWAGGCVTSDGKVVALVSYNGRVWIPA